MKREGRRTRPAVSLLALLLMGAAYSILLACSGNTSINTDVGIHRSSNGNWGHSISVGINNHGRRW